jgi:hypothetical protein
VTGAEILDAVREEMDGLGLDWLLDDEYALRTVVMLTCEVLRENDIVHTEGPALTLLSITRESREQVGDETPREETREP